jgi:hypothetical protein
MLDEAPQIPVYVSSPSRLTPAQAATAGLLETASGEHGLRWRRLGASDYDPRSPLDAVLSVIRECHGGLVLGFEHSRAESVTVRPGQETETVYKSKATASPWQQIEAAMLVARGLPVLIFRDRDVRDGIFDTGAGGRAVFDVPTPDRADWLGEVFAHWSAEVRAHYEEANSVFDVFLSFSGEDEAAAREAFQFLTAQGLRVFFSRESIPHLAQAEYMKAINDAVDSARHIVVVSSSPAGFAKPWVEREWMMFLNEKLSGRKSGNVVVVTAGPVPVARLPIALRSQQVVPLSADGLREVLRFVRPARDRGVV